MGVVVIGYLLVLLVSILSRWTSTCGNGMAMLLA